MICSRPMFHMEHSAGDVHRFSGSECPTWDTFQPNELAGQSPAFKLCGERRLPDRWTPLVWDSPESVPRGTFLPEFLEQCSANIDSASAAFPGNPKIGIMFHVEHEVGHRPPSKLAKSFGTSPTNKDDIAYYVPRGTFTSSVPAGTQLWKGGLYQATTRFVSAS